MYDIDSRGRGIEIQPQKSVTMELIFKSVPSNIRTLKLNLHPFIYYGGGFMQSWQEFDLVMTNIRMPNLSKPEKIPAVEKKEKQSIGGNKEMVAG